MMHPRTHTHNHTLHTNTQIAYRAADSRLTQETTRRHVLRVLKAWREKYLFNADYLNGLTVGVLQRDSCVHVWGGEMLRVLTAWREKYIFSADYLTASR